MAYSVSTLATLPPELFHIISCHIPLYIRPSSLLALALADRRLNEIVIPRLLYQHVVLEGEKPTLQFLDMLKIQAIALTGATIKQEGKIPLAYHVRRLCISTDLSICTQLERTRTDAVSQVRALVNLSALCHLVSLAFHVDHSYYIPLELFKLPGMNNSFWRELKHKCPKLKNISITGLVTAWDDLEDKYSDLFNYQGLESFRLQYGGSMENYIPRFDKLIDNFSTSSPFIHTLSLCLVHCEVNGTADNGIFRKRFPHLRVLALQNFIIEHPEVTSDFWSCHPNLEQIELLHAVGPCFEGVSSGMLPKLSVLMASFDNVRTVVPLLGDQLVNLTITSSINAQVPYLLRSVLPDGLVSLRSLGIYQLNFAWAYIWEGGNWHEDEHGNVSQVSMALPIDPTYIISIARGAPNLEELELIGECRSPIGPIASALSMFSNLKRLYISGNLYPRGVPNQQFIPKKSRRSFLEDAFDLAYGCATLESITEITSRYCRNVYMRAKIQRSEDGIFSVYERPGYGRMIGLEDLDYPGFLPAVKKV